MFIVIIILLIIITILYRHVFRPVLWVSWKIMWNIIRFAIKVLIIGAAIAFVIFQTVAPGL